MIDPDKLRRVAKRKGIESAYQLWQALAEVGHETSESQAGRLWNGRSDPRQSTMDILCEALDCEQGEIIAGRNRKKARAARALPTSAKA